jgi:hypothetical protein
VVNRPAGGARSERHEREPYDWYCEGERPVRQLLAALPPPPNHLIYDPCCGRGNILDVFAKLGFKTLGSDLFDRADPCAHEPTRVSERHPWFKCDITGGLRHPPFLGRPTEVWTNPPYSYETDICERVMRSVLDLPIIRACFLVPIAFLCSGERYGFFTKLRPSHIGVLCERPYTTFKGGMADYIWLVMRPPHRWRSETIWIRPD